MGPPRGQAPVLGFDRAAFDSGSSPCGGGGDKLWASQGVVEPGWWRTEE